MSDEKNLPICFVEGEDGLINALYKLDPDRPHELGAFSYATEEDLRAAGYVRLDEAPTTPPPHSSDSP